MDEETQAPGDAGPKPELDAQLDAELDDSAAAATASGAPAPAPWAQEPAWLLALTPRIGATYALIAANVLVFAVMFASGVAALSPSAVELIEWGGNIAELTTNGQWWRLWTACFAHVGAIHLAFNMFVLFRIGRFCERLFGPVGFTLLYLFAGTTGSLASIAWRQDIVSVGASGAVFGVIGGLAAVALRKPAGFPPDSLKPLARSVLAFLGYNLLFGLSIPNIDMAGHVGGLAGGLCAGLVLCQPLDEGTAKRRLPRDGVFAGLAAAIIAAAILAWPPVADVTGTFQRFAAIESAAIVRAQQLGEQYDAGTLDGPAVASALEGEVLGPWHAVVEELAALDRVPPQRREMITLVVTYGRAREAHWQCFADAVRTDDARRLEECIALQATADAAVLAIQARAQSPDTE